MEMALECFKNCLKIEETNYLMISALVIMNMTMNDENLLEEALVYLFKANEVESTKNELIWSLLLLIYNSN